MAWWPVIAWVVWVAVAMIGWWVLTAPVPEAAPVPPDPYAQEVAQFRRELHDWDR